MTIDPFRRLLGKEDGEGASNYDNVFAWTETFVIYSIYDVLTHGHESCKTEF